MTTLVDAVKELLIHNYVPAHRLASVHALRKLLSACVGVDFIKQLILDGFTPEDVPHRLMGEQVLKAAMRAQLAQYIRNLTLGYSPLQSHGRIQVLYRGATDEDGRLARAVKTLNRVRSELLPAAYDPAEEPIDYLPLHSFVEQQKLNDPAWINDSKIPKSRWDTRLAQNTKVINTRFSAFL